MSTDTIVDAVLGLGGLDITKASREQLADVVAVIAHHAQRNVEDLGLTPGAAVGAALRTIAADAPWIAFMLSERQDEVSGLTAEEHRAAEVRFEVRHLIDP